MLPPQFSLALDFTIGTPLNLKMRSGVAAGNVVIATGIDRAPPSTLGRSWPPRDISFPRGNVGHLHGSQLKLTSVFSN
jgi:hypothetical protein